MKQEKGFTLIEMMIAIAIISILSAVAIPNMIRWRNNAKHRSAVNTLVGDLALAKHGAIRHNTNVFVDFSANRYQIRLDTNNSNTPDVGDRILRDRDLPSGVSITSTFPDNRISFDSRGRWATASGNVVVKGTAGSSAIEVNRLGRINQT